MSGDERARLLAELAGLRLPQNGGLAPGWWLLGALLLVAGIAGAVVVLRRRRARAPAERLRAESRAELAALHALLDGASSEPAPPALAREVLGRASVLARRLALAGAPRERVAALRGPAWLHELDALSGTRRFADGPGRLLDTGPYEAAPVASVGALDELLGALGTLTDAVAERVAGGGSARRVAS